MLLFVIVKKNFPRELLEEEEVHFVQAPVDQELQGENFEDRANDPMEEDNDDNNTIEEDEEDVINRFIRDTFNNVGIGDDGNQRASEPLNEGLKISLLSTCCCC